MFGIERPLGRTPFQGPSLDVTSPRAKAQAKAPWAILLDRSAVVGNRFAVKYNGLLANYSMASFPWRKPLSQQPLAS
jgi:hypothetical protein